MIPSIDLIKTMLEGVRESVFGRINSMGAALERKIKDLDDRVHTPDFGAKEGQKGFIKNKPTLIGRPGEGKGSEVFNDEINSAMGQHSHAEGEGTTANGDGAHVEGVSSRALGLAAHAEGYNTEASGRGAHAEGGHSKAKGQYSHAEGQYTTATDHSQHVQGRYNVEDTEKKYAHIVGNGDVLSGPSNAHTLDWEGNAWFAGSVRVGGSGQEDDAGDTLLGAKTAASLFVGADAPNFTGSVSMGRKQGTTVGDKSVALGHNAEASGNVSYAAGQGVRATASWSHAEGYNTLAGGSIAHAEGYGCEARGYASHAEGIGTVAASTYQHVQGQYNLEDAAQKYAHIVGNGKTAQNESGETVTLRSNAHTLDWAGNAWFAGTLEGTALILKSSGGKYFKLTVDDTGVLRSAELLR